MSLDETLLGSEIGERPVPGIIVCQTVLVNERHLQGGHCFLTISDVMDGNSLFDLQDQTASADLQNYPMSGTGMFDGLSLGRSDFFRLRHSPQWVSEGASWNHPRFTFCQRAEADSDAEPEMVVATACATGRGERWLENTCPGRRAASPGRATTPLARIPCRHGRCRSRGGDGP